MSTGPAGDAGTGPGRIALNLSPFDGIRRTDEAGEYWLARELMPLLGYERWERFLDAIDRARVAAEVAGHDPEAAISRRREIGTGGRRREDFRLTRFAAYLIAMNGDPRKIEIAAAQTYFAVKTRQAEVSATPALAAPRVLSLDEAAAMLRQHYGLPYTVVDLTRAMRAAGVTRLSGGPKKDHFSLLWFNGSAWCVVADYLDILARVLRKNEQRVQELVGHGVQLSLDDIEAHALTSQES